MRDNFLELPFKVGNFVVSGSSGNWSAPGPAPGAEVDIDNCSLTITTYGRPILIWVAPDGTTNASGLGFTGSGNSPQYAIRRDTVTEIVRPTGSISPSQTPTALCAFDIQPAGTYSYKLTVRQPSGITPFAKYVRLVAWEFGT